VLVLLMEGFMIHAIYMASSVMIYTAKFHEDGYRRSSNIKVTSQKLERLQCWYY
jgi:hypothetical protein